MKRFFPINSVALAGALVLLTLLGVVAPTARGAEVRVGPCT